MVPRRPTLPKRGREVGDRNRTTADDDSAPDEHAQHERHLTVVPEPHHPGVYERFVKPVMDRTAGVILSVVTLPVVAVLAVLVRRDIGSPVIFRQQRMGRLGRPFTVYKLRTMAADRRQQGEPIEHEDRRRTHKSHHDPRHTELGRRLRRFSLDEIPQFWNLAKGDMSIVGPRPELPEVVARYEAWQHRRHEVKPGLTGLWQVTARGDIPMHEATDLDVAYVENVSFLGDLKILMKTPRAIFGSTQGQ
jgi:lipopolysaccharide/colanic/teichoic acid biosynthesis glycosyltransferase